MKLRSLSILVLGLSMTIAAAPVGAQRKRDWQEGICRDITTDSKLVSVYSTGTTTGNTVTGSSVPLSIQTAYYIVEAPDMIFVGAQRLRWRWSRPIDFTINRPIRFAVDKRDLYLLDAGGKEHRVELMKKIAKEK